MTSIWITYLPNLNQKIKETKIYNKELSHSHQDNNQENKNFYEVRDLPKNKWNSNCQTKEFVKYWINLHSINELEDNSKPIWNNSLIFIVFRRRCNNAVIKTNRAKMIKCLMILWVSRAIKRQLAICKKRDSYEGAIVKIKKAKFNNIHISLMQLSNLQS